MALAFERVIFEGLLAVALDLNKSFSKRKRLDRDFTEHAR
jgi:hypothetical protein